MKKLVALFLALCLALGVMGIASAEGALVPGTYEGSGDGFMGGVKVTVTVDDKAITALEVSHDETPSIGGVIADAVKEQLIGLSEEEAIAKVDDLGADVMTSATFAAVTRGAVKEGLTAAFAKAKGEGTAEPAAEIGFKAGEYEVSGEGYNGVSTFKVTFSDSKLENIEVVNSTETAHVGDVAFDIMIPEMIEAGGSGVDGVSGATFSARALRSAVNDAAQQAECTNLEAFKAAKVEHTAQDPIDVTFDVVVVGAGGAGIAAAAQAAQDGNTVLVIEKNAEVGGNTLVSGGQYQSVMPYLVWNPDDPDATTGVYEFTGETYDKVKSVQGCIKELNIILHWS